MEPAVRSMLRLMAQYTCSPTVSPLLAELKPMSGMRMPLWRSLASSGCVTTGSQSTGTLMRWKMLLLARALVSLTLNSSAASSQSGRGNWQEVTVPL